MHAHFHYCQSDGNRGTAHVFSWLKLKIDVFCINCSISNIQHLLVHSPELSVDIYLAASLPTSRFHKNNALTKIPLERQGNKDFT